jgi:DNA-binding FrmR family transcriptional regulator
MLSKLDTKFDATIEQITAANSAITTLKSTIDSRPTKAELNQAIEQAQAEIQEDIAEATAIIDYSFEDNKITPAEK